MSAAEAQTAASAAAADRSARRERRGAPPGEPRRVGYVYVAPALLVYAVFLLFPLVRAVQISFYKWDGLTLGSWVGLRNYADILADPALRAAFGHAAVLMVFFALIPTAVGLVLASVVARARVRGLTFFRTVIFLPQVVAMVVVAVTWRQIYAPDGPINDLLRFVGLGDLARGWLGDFDLALPAVGMVGTWVSIGLCFILFLAGTGKIPRELYEAARIDGAGPIREFASVTLPAVRNEIVVALTHGDRGAAHLRLGVRDDRRRARQRDHRSVLRGVPASVRTRCGGLRRGDRRGAHSRHSAAEPRDRPHR